MGGSPLGLLVKPVSAEPAAGHGAKHGAPPPAMPPEHHDGAREAPAVAGAAGQGGQASDRAAVRRVVETLAEYTQAKDLAALDTLYAPDAWVQIIEGAGLNRSWADYRDNHLRPELAGFESFAYRFYEVEPQVRGDLAWAPFRYDLTVHSTRGHVEIEGRGTAILEKRGDRWLVVHLHTSGRRKGP